jgi:hypothetical protein
VAATCLTSWVAALIWLAVRGTDLSVTECWPFLLGVWLFSFGVSVLVLTEPK